MGSSRIAQMGLLLLLVLVLGSVFLVVSPSSERPSGEPVTGDLLTPSGTSATTESRPRPARSAASLREGIEAPAADTAGGPLSLRLLWEDDSPIEAAQLLFAAGDTLIAIEETDAAGRFVGAEPLAGATEVFALRGPLVLGHAQLERTDEQVLTIGLGSPLGAVVTVNGSVPQTPLSLELTATPRAWGALPKPIAKQLQARGWSRSLPVTCDALGRFRVNGLRSDWSGNLRMPDRLELAEGGTSLALEAPRTGLLIELVTRPLLFGQVVASDGAPLPGAAVQSTIHSGPKSPGGPSSSATDSVFTDTDGRFAIALGPAPPERAELSITATGFGNLTTETELDGLVDHDLGVLRLSPSRSLQVRTVTPAGEPIAGAIISHAFGQSAPTDASGLTEVTDLPSIDVELIADALNHRRGRRLAPPSALEPFEIVLEPMAALDVTIVAPDGKPERGLTLVLEGGAFKAALSFGENLAQNGFGVRGTGPTSTKTYGDGRVETRAEYIANKDGHVLAANLESGVAIELSLREASGEALGWSTRVTLAPGETRVIEVALRQPLGWLKGVVRDPAGQPVRRARITATGSGGGRGLEAKTDEAGDFELGPLLAKTCDLWIESYGLAPTAVLGHPITAPLEVTLDKGFELVLAAQDATGKAWPVTEAGALWRGRSFTTATDAEEPLEAGQIRLEHLPDLPIQIVAKVLGCKIQETYQGGGGKLVLTVPTPGRAKLAWTPAALPPETAPRIEFQASGDLAGLWSRPLTHAEIEAGSLTLDTLLAGSYGFRLLWQGPEGTLESLTGKATIKPDGTTEVALH